MAKLIEKIENGCKVADRTLGSGNGTYILIVEGHISAHLEKLLECAIDFDMSEIIQNHSGSNGNNGMAANYQTQPNSMVAEANHVTHGHQLSDTATAYQQVRII